jgi:hypothetical protein
VKLYRVDNATDNTEADRFLMASTGAVLITAGAPPTTGDYLEASYVV